MASGKKRRHWLEVAEYIALFGSFVGLILTAAFQQVIYAFASLWLFLALNLANRQRLKQGYATKAEVTKLKHQFAARTQVATRTEIAKLIRRVRRKIASIPLPPPADLSQVEATIATINTRLTALEALDLRPINWQIRPLA